VLASVGRTTRASSFCGVSGRHDDGYASRGDQPRGPLVRSRGARNSAVRTGEFDQITAVAVELGTRENHANRIDRRFDSAAACAGNTHGGDDVVGHSSIQARSTPGRSTSGGFVSSLRCRNDVCDHVMRLTAVRAIFASING